MKADAARANVPEGTSWPYSPQRFYMSVRATVVPARLV